MGVVLSRRTFFAHQRRNTNRVLHPMLTAWCQHSAQGLEECAHRVAETSTMAAADTLGTRSEVVPSRVLATIADPHQSPPETSASATVRPLWAERATATMARTDAMPSSTVAPRIGAPSKIVVAKPST